MQPSNHTEKYTNYTGNVSENDSEVVLKAETDFFLVQCVIHFLSN